MNTFEENQPSNNNESPVNSGGNALPQSSGGTTTNGRHYARNYAASRKRAWRNTLTPAQRRKISRRQSARIAKNLSDGYVRGAVAARLKISRAEVTPEMILEKRRALQKKRIRKLIRDLVNLRKNP